MDNQQNGSSLSMRLRVEATKSPSHGMDWSSPLRHSLSTSGLSSDSSPVSKAFPVIKKQHAESPSGGKTGASRTFKEKVIPPQFRTKNQFDRLSGSYDFSASSSTFPDRFHVMHPIAMCVRCSSHASVCMPCCEKICDETLTFYRKTRAIGASSLFTKAISEAGLSKTVRFLLFHLWKNSFRTRKTIAKKKKFAVERLFGNNIVYPPFNAWKRFTKESKDQRKDAEIARLTERVDNLEKELKKLDIVKSASEVRVKSLEKESQQSKVIMDNQGAEIAELTKQLGLEKERVLGMSAICEPFFILTSIVYDIALPSEQAYIRSKLLHLNEPSVPSHNYHGIFTPDDLSSEPLEQMLLKWFNVTSEDAGSVIEPNGLKSLNLYLPPYSAMTSLQDIGDGIQLSRVIVAMIFQSATSAVRINGGAGVGTSTSNDGSKGVNSNNVLTQNQLKDMRKLAHPGLQFLKYVLGMAVAYLGVPVFKSASINAGDVETILSLLMTLFIIKVPTRHPHDVKEINFCTQEFELATQEIIQANDRKAAVISPLIEVQKAWARATNSSLGQNLGEKEILELAAQESGHAAISLQNDEESKTFEDDDVLQGVQEGKAATSEGVFNEAATVAVAQESVEDQEEKNYRQLCTAIDKFLTFKHEITGAIGLASDGMVLIKKVKNQLKELASHDESGCRAASSIRARLISSYISDMLKENGKTLSLPEE